MSYIAPVSQSSFGLVPRTQPLLIKPAGYRGPILKKSSPNIVSVMAGAEINTGTSFWLLSTDTPVTMPTLTAGTDYSVWATPSKTLVAVADMIFTPATPPASGAVKIGGFHYGLVAPGTTVAGGSFNSTTSSPLVSMVWAQSDVDNIAGINKFSFWDLSWRPATAPANGMTCVVSDQGTPLFWVDIYFCGTQYVDHGTSWAGSNVASGSVLPKMPYQFGGNNTVTYTNLSYYAASEIAFSAGKRLLSYQEFSASAFGVTENQALGGTTVTIPTTIRQPSFTSKYGLEQATGHHWTWGDVAHTANAGANTSGAQRGQTFGTPFPSAYGGSRAEGAYAGSRCYYSGSAPWSGGWNTGLRAACDAIAF